MSVQPSQIAPTAMQNKDQMALSTILNGGIKMGDDGRWKPKGPCHLARLPPELRIMIYRYLFPSHAEIIIANGRKACWYGRLADDRLTLNAGIIRTCKLFYMESIPLLFARNEFITSASSLPRFCDRFLITIGQSCAATIRKIGIDFTAICLEKEDELEQARDLINSFVKMMEQHPGLEKLHQVAFLFRVTEPTKPAIDSMAHILLIAMAALVTRWSSPLALHCMDLEHYPFRAMKAVVTPGSSAEHYKRTGRKVTMLG